MRDLDFLSRYLPEYGRIDCFPILNHGYLYTIDEHTIRSIEFLDRIFFSTSPKLEEYKGGIVPTREELEKANTIYKKWK